MRTKISLPSSPPFVLPRISPALSHPLWWAALLLLAANDHLLKGSGWLPGWLTGKVSDFAFLVVAPPLAEALTPRVKARRALALLCVVVPYVLGKAFPSCTVAIESLMHAAGLPWRLWTDPTDLIAIAILPATWHLMVGPQAGVKESVVWRDVRSRVGVALGAAACIATSNISEPLVRPFIVNASGSGRTIAVRWLLKSSPCGRPLREVAAALQNGDMSEPISIVLDMNAFAAVDQPPPVGVSPIGMCSNDLRSEHQFDPDPGFCPVALVELAGVPALLTRTSGYGGAGVCAPSVTSSERAAGEIRLDSDTKGSLRWTVGPNVESVPFVIPPSWSTEAPIPGSCGAIAAKYTSDLQSGRGCTTDDECRPVAVQACDAVNATSSAAVAADLSSYTAAGCSLLPTACESNPAICVAGQCAVDCPMTNLGACPPACPGTRTGDTWRFPPCVNDLGDLCKADERGIAFVCAPPPEPPVGCHHWCSSPMTPGQQGS
jgi:hypothetical protein